MAPSGADLQALEARRADLTAALAPGDEEAIKQAIRALKGGFPSYGADAVGAAYQTEFYFKALAGFPVWAVHEACARFRDGRNATPWNSRECPTSAQVAAECRAIIEPVQDELTPLSDVLDAEVAPDPDADKAARAAAVLRWEQDIRPKMAAKDDAKKPKESPEQTLERLKEEAKTPVSIGAGLGKILAGMKKGQAA